MSRDSQAAPLAPNAPPTALGGGAGQVALNDGTTNRSVVTAANPGGAYTFSSVSPGSYTVTVSGAGVATHIVLVEVVAGTDLPLNINVDAT